MESDIDPSSTPHSNVNSWVEKLGPGLITGAADDDPSGIATYSQAGAASGYNILWTILLTYPLMVAIQVISARIGSAATDWRPIFDATIPHGCSWHGDSPARGEHDQYCG